MSYDYGNLVILIKGNIKKSIYYITNILNYNYKKFI